MTTQTSTQSLSKFLQTISVPARLEILLAIGQGEACVCHLEALLGLRQAYISQHLMAMLEAGILVTRRERRFIYYRLADARLLPWLEQAGQLFGSTWMPIQPNLQPVLALNVRRKSDNPPSLPRIKPRD